MVHGTDQICITKEKGAFIWTVKIRIGTPSYLEINWIQIQISVETDSPLSPLP